MDPQNPGLAVPAKSRHNLNVVHNSKRINLVNENLRIGNSISGSPRPDRLIIVVLTYVAAS